MTSTPDSPVAVSAADFLWFVDQALDGMVAIVRRLGDDGANRSPDPPGANSPFAILTHCLGVMEFWGGAIVAERPVQRDRQAEFRAVGAVEELARRAAEARQRLAADVAGTDLSAAPPDVLRPEDTARPYGRSKGAVLLHIMEEVFQHLGHMEVTRDVLLAGS